MTQPNLKIQNDGSTATASANTWSGTSTVVNSSQFFTKGTATDAEVFVETVIYGANAVAGSITPLLVGSATTAFSTTASVSPDKGTLSAVGASTASSHAHYAQLQYPYYRMQYSPATTATTAMVVTTVIFSGLQDSLDATDQ